MKIPPLYKVIRRAQWPMVALLAICTIQLSAQPLPAFTPAGYPNEQELTLTELEKDVTVEINAPETWHSGGKTWIVLFALPNGNSIEWTRGKNMKPGDDWHYGIQHIAAQTRFVRQLDKKNNYVVAYLVTRQKSWPAWRREQRDTAGRRIRHIVEYITGLFKDHDPHIILNGHSGGGSFIFGYFNAFDNIPTIVDRIAFLDSDYGYEDSLHKEKLVTWLRQDKKNRLCVLAYNDSVVIYNGKPLVSATGGTWYRSRKMQRDLSSEFLFKTTNDTSFIHHSALNGRVSFLLKQNPSALIYHTVQVERNGFIYSLLFDTKYDRSKYFRYFGERAYDRFIE